MSLLPTVGQGRAACTGLEMRVAFVASGDQHDFGGSAIFHPASTPHWRLVFGVLLDVLGLSGQLFGDLAKAIKRDRS